MGIVRAIQKGDVPASKFSKSARDAAKDMSKSDVKKFAKTKHKGLPKKVKQEIREDQDGIRIMALGGSSNRIAISKFLKLRKIVTCTQAGVHNRHLRSLRLMHHGLCLLCSTGVL